MMRPYDSMGKHGPIASGLVVTACVLAGMRFTGAALNPLRAAGPAIARSVVPPLPALLWDYHYVYWAGPMVGGLAAGVVTRYLLWEFHRG
eukprot:EC714727.1.p4 GENE.EC714727.1~~EC714727.1.p4  ORF type:complete len:90 (+),score=20.45 EC714727.1:3-272(+)